jgi:transcriptional regulator with XRE-family HTH domain/tetratricopeptide (TPR) repeat protein
MRGSANQPDPQAAVLGARLRTAREAAGLSLSELAAKIPYSKAALGHYETGRRTASSEVLTWYQRACGEFADPVTVLSVLSRADVDRRSFLRDAAYSAALTATALTSVSDAARLVHVTPEETRVGMAEVEAVQGVTDAFLRLDEVRGGKVGRSAVAEFLATDVAALLRSRFASADVRAQAFSAASELAYMAGFKAHDAGQDGLGQRYFLSALRLAEESGTPGQDGFAFRILALHASDVHQAHNSVPLAERAVLSARGNVSPDTMALFEVALARCYAESGDKAQALKALRRAEPWIMPEATTEIPRWAALFCPNKASVTRQAAKTFLAIGDLAEAERYQYMSATIWHPRTHTRIHAISLAETGLIRWRMGNHEDAANLWRTALPTLTAVSSERGSKLLRRIRKAAPELIDHT